MITLTILGLDQYIVGRLSREMLKNLAKIYEVSEDDINFVAPNNMVFHNGVEQTSWNVLVRVHAPHKVRVVQDDVANVISVGIGEMAINLAIEFYYYSTDDRYERISKDYPRFITESNLVNVDGYDSEDDLYDDDDYSCDDDDCCCHEDGEECECHHEHGKHHNCSCHHDEIPSEEELYTGDIFADFNKKMNGDN
ncbi:MAG: DUF1904 family protein [Bacilli bacterium]